MDRKAQLILPCSHSYCEQCIDEWSVLQFCVIYFILSCALVSLSSNEFTVVCPEIKRYRYLMFLLSYAEDERISISDTHIA